MTPDLEKAEDLAADLERNGRPNDAALVRGLAAKHAELVRLVREYVAMLDKINNDTDTTNSHDGTYDKAFAAEYALRAAVRGDTEGT